MDRGVGTPALIAVGNLDLLRCRLLALFCSVKCPGDVILQTYDLVRAVRDARIPVIGGFHSPMEKECLRFLLRGAQPVVICPARSLEGMRLPVGWRDPLKAGRLLLLSPFAAPQRRATSDMARQRNALVAAVSHAPPGSKTEELARQALAWAAPVWALEDDSNRGLFACGVRPVTPTTAARAWAAYESAVPLS
jgi:hypothetical protein